jgi:phage shock protein PspC (stress-responsive transcriptional regulator)
VQTTETRRLIRRADGRVLAGVAGGLADHTDTNPLWWRVAFVITAFAGGVGILAYLFLWWLLPRADLPQSAGQRFAAHFPDAPAWFGIALLMFGAVLLAGQLGLGTPDVGWALLLIGLGFVLFRRAAERNESPEDGGGEPPAAFGTTETLPPAGMPPWRPSDEEPPPPWEGFPAAPAAAPRPAPRPPKPPREHAWLGWLAFGLALCTTGVVWLLRDGGSIHLSLGQMFALPLAILGLGLLVGAFAGRARWTILPAIALIPLVIVGSVVTVPLNGRWDDRHLTPQSTVELAESYEQSGGSLTMDLSAIEPSTGLPATIHVAVGVGEIEVWLRKGSPVTITAHAGVGQVRMIGDERSGLDVTDSLHVAGLNPIRLDLDVNIGQVVVLYLAPPTRPRDRGKA